MKITFLLLLLILPISAIHAQSINSHSIDSLKSIINQKSDDTTKVKLLARYSYNVVFTFPEQALSFAQEGLLLARSLDYQKGQILCNSSAGFARWITGDYTEANDIFNQSVKEAEFIKDTALLLTALDGLTSSYRDQGNQNEAAKYARRGLNLTHNSFWWKVMMGSVFNAMSMPDSALYYLLPVDTTFSMAFCGYSLVEVGKAYQKKGNINNALSYYKKSIETLSRSTNIKDLVIAYNGVASLFAGQGNLDSCIYYSRHGLEIAQKLSYRQGAYESYLLLSSAFEPNNNAEALRYYKLAAKVKEEMSNTIKQTQALSLRFASQLQQIELEKGKLEAQNRIRTLILTSIIIIFVIVTLLLYRNMRLKQKAKFKIEKAYSELKSTQSQLIQSEKMASLGELTAGIAHEIQNPLNFVNNFSEVNTELIQEMKDEIEKGNLTEVRVLANDIAENEQKINHHGKRADAIVKGMLQHSRSSSGVKEPTNINALADEYLRLAYHGLRAKDKSFNAILKTDFDETIGMINVIPQDIGRVILNLINNAFYAVNEKMKLQTKDLQGFQNLEGLDAYEPTVSVSTKRMGEMVSISVKDNGNGIPPKVLDKIFQPFFTTKPTGQGTGLGLSMSYDIVKSHGGELKVVTNEGEGSEFIIQLSDIS